MILIYDISDEDKNPFLVTWINRAGDPLSTPTPPRHTDTQQELKKLKFSHTPLPIVHDRKRQ